MAVDIVGTGWAFPPHIDAQGGLALTNERNEIEQAIYIILSTAMGQRVMRPEFGCRIHELIFAPNDNETAAKAIRYVQQALGRWEPRIRLLEVEAGPDPEYANRLMITIEYEIKSTRDQRSLVHPFYLIPEE
ncbi:MAG: GPW/gp25 family protein [Candidatus Promineifilaceae bacterium]|nr:GPW/gp25 family protein [Candidatus Promineifilaceae bacterium]